MVLALSENCLTKDYVIKAYVVESSEKSFPYIPCLESP